MARTPDQQRNSRMDPEQFQNLGCVLEEFWTHENQPERQLRRVDFRSQPLRPLLQPGFVKAGGPMRRHRVLILHGKKLMGSGRMAIPTQGVAPEFKRWP